MPKTVKRSASAAKAAAAKPAAKKTSAPAKRLGREAADPGEVAYARLQERLAKLPAARITQPRAQVSAAASFVLSDTAGRLADRALRARFATLPSGEFDHSALDDVIPAAQAALWAQAQLATAAASVPGARLPVELIEEAAALQKRMLAVCAYHFREDPRLTQQVDDIRGGQGYLDLAEDLRRLAALYRSQHDTLKQDLRFYQEADAATALRLSQRISSELRTQGPDTARELAWRTWALLLDLYEEVARGGRFLLGPAGEDAFPRLNSVGRSPARRTKVQPESPSPAPQDGAAPASS